MSAEQLPKHVRRNVNAILHPTDFSPTSELAFAHALRVALANQAELTLLHVGTKDDLDRFPAVRETLQRWQLLKDGAQRGDVSELGIGIKKVVSKERNVVAAITEQLEKRDSDLLVLSTHGRHGLASWIKPSIAEKAFRKTPIPTLFVPETSRGCVRLDSGKVTMERVLIPVDHDPPADLAIERGLRAIEAYGTDQSRLSLLYVGAESEFPEVRVQDERWNVDRIVRDGNPVTEILDAAEACEANLLVMVTKGKEGFLDVLHGSTTEQVLREAPCPVLAVPSQP